MLGNLHTHTHFSDGSSPPEDYVEEARKLGFSVLGFTDHSPVPFPNTFAIPEGGLPRYVDTIARIMGRGKRDHGRKTKYGVPQSGIRNRSEAQIYKANAESGNGNPESEIDILLGLEYDYIPGLTGSISSLRKQFPFDYIIGSVHLIRNDHPGLIWFIDGPKAEIYDKGLREVFHGDTRKAVTAYWRQLQEMVVMERPDIVGHLDKIKMHNRERYFSEDDGWYGSLVDETLDMISQTGIIVEVNTRGLYKKRSDSLFPGPLILKKIFTRKIPVTLSSDAHRPKELSLCFPEAIATLSGIGFRSHWLLTGTGWREVAL